MSNVITYDIYGFLLLLAFVPTISYHNWFVYVELYYLQPYTIIWMRISCSYDMSYVITFDIWEVRIMSYSALFLHVFEENNPADDIEMIANSCPTKYKRILIENHVTTHSYNQLGIGDNIWPLYEQLYFLSLLLATSWPKFRLAIIECMYWNFSLRFSC